MARGEARLDQPKADRALLPRPHYDPEAFGRFSETIARFIGTARFLVIQTCIIVVWLAVNSLPKSFFQGFDRYPLPFLTLVLSLQAAYDAPLILLAQNRQADRDRISLDEDRGQYARALAEAEFLARELASVRIALGEVATRDFLRSELRDLLAEITEARPADDAAPS
ncbi:MAG: hypothetical protein QOG49_349 [Frankiaceae bacterium]|nr:hypothetical protein [Frankiaceae bacterium]